ncbi:MAG: cysteine--tRNA ligase, partial [Gammaproteobacteria bacterium]|nr:cysteine--tRNA ligase [Gammaproteobacteria bacterium]
IIAMIQGLLDQGYAYSADNGDVYYEVGRFARYGVLSGRNLEEERVGARVEVGEAKRDPLDFVLWKAAKPGEPSWDSPWGPGRPGWHIECSAMSTCHLGEHFDIHGGGLDLKFPHHENEIAQTEALTGRPFVNLWMHNGHVQVNEEKMSKSLGNFFTLREIYARYRPEEVRYFLLSSHYRSPLNYSDEQLEQARNALTRFYTALRGLPDAPAPEDDAYGRRFFQAMDDDFNTPEALAVLFDLAREINRLRGEDIRKAAPLGAALRRLGGVLGLLQRDPEEFLKESYGAAPAAPRRATADEDLDAARIERLIAQRAQARRDRHWAESDRIREQLKRHGIVLEDGPGGTTWRRETVKPD